MLKYFRKRKQRGQSTLEYVILIIIILGALLSIQFYIKRGIQGRLKSAADDIGDQFSPGNSNVIKIVNTHSKTRDTFDNGVTKSSMIEKETTNEYMNSFIITQNFEFFGKD